MRTADQEGEEGLLASTGTLDWAHPSDLRLTDRSFLAGRKPKSAHVILAADVIYSAEHPAMLVDVFTYWLSKNTTSRAIICLALRAAYLDEINEFWDRMEKAGMVCVSQGQERADEKVFDDEVLCEWSVWGWKDV